MNIVFSSVRSLDLVNYILSLVHLFVNEEHKQCEKMHEVNLLISEDELDSRGPSDFNPEQENGVVKFDIGSFALCHRRLCHLVEPFVTCYKNFLFVTR